MKEFISFNYIVMMKNIAKLLLIFGLVILIIGIFVIFQDVGSKKNNDNNNSISQKENVKEKSLEEIKTKQVVEDELNSFFTLVFDENVTRENLEKIVNIPLDSYYIFYGKDSFVRTLLMVNTSEDIKEYVNKKNELIPKLEKNMKDNFVFELGEYKVLDSGDVVQEICFKSFYNIKFVDDFMMVRNKLLKYTDVNIDDFANRFPTQEELLKIYKLNVKTLEIMSFYFSDYINNNQEIKYDFVYKKVDNEISVDYFSLYLNLSGAMYEADKDTELKQQECEKRALKIINESINRGILDIKNPYKLNS